MAESGIYEIVNLVNGKRYVGSAINLRVRWRQHRYALARGDHTNTLLQRAWAKYGDANFAFRVLENCSPDQLIAREQHHIDVGYDYNICPTAGSSLGRKLSVTTKQKIADKAKGRKMPPRSDEYREKLSKAMKARKPNPERVAKMADTKRGSSLTDEHKAKIGEGVRKAIDEGRLVVRVSDEAKVKIAETLRKKSECPSVRKKLSEQARIAWEKRPVDARHRHMEMVRAARGPITEDQRLAISERQRGRAMHPNAREALLKANKGKKQNPEVVSARADKMREWWTPERKAQRAAAMRAYHAKRKSNSE